MQTPSLATLVETLKHMISGQNYIRCFFYFLVLVSILVAANNKRRKRKQEEQETLENGLTIEKACFYEKKASDYGGKAVITIFISLLLLAFVMVNEPFAFCLEAICVFAALASTTKMVICHNKAVPYFQEMRRETAASLGPDSRLADYVLQFMECTEHKDPYMSSGRDVNEKVNEAITAAERELFAEILLEARRENDAAKPILADMEQKLSEMKKATGKTRGFVLEGLQKRIDYLMEYDRITLKSAVQALIHAMKFVEDD